MSFKNGFQFLGLATLIAFIAICHVAKRDDFAVSFTFVQIGSPHLSKILGVTQPYAHFATHSCRHNTLLSSFPPYEGGLHKNTSTFPAKYWLYQGDM